MAQPVEEKTDVCPDLDDYLQCPVCYEIPTGQIFQCNEGHHVCSRCKARLDLCPVCRSLFFGTRNYALEKLITNLKHLQAFKPGGKVTATISGSESTVSAENSVLGTTLEEEGNEEINNDLPNRLRAPQSCKGLFRCLCCKNSSERLPAARLLNHLRYFHAPDLIEGNIDDNEYQQAWQMPTIPGRIVIAVRVTEMGVFFLVVEINSSSIYAWVSMAASPWIAHEFTYTITICGNDREAIFSDCVWSVRACEGALKKRGHCLSVNGLDANALTASNSMNTRLIIRHTTPDQLAIQNQQPRAVLRVANRVSRNSLNGSQVVPSGDDLTLELEPLLQGLQNDVARLSRAFATLGRERNSFLRATVEEQNHQVAEETDDETPALQQQVQEPEYGVQLSRNARRRLRQRLRTALANLTPAPPQFDEDTPPSRQSPLGFPGNEEFESQPQTSSGISAPDSTSGPTRRANGSARNAAGAPRANKKKRRHRR